METLRSLLDQALMIWNDSTAAGRLGIGLLLVICIGGIAGVGVWSSQPHYVTLAANLDPLKASKVIDALDAANISHEVKGAGTIVMVDKRYFARAKIAAGRVGIESIDMGLEEASPWMDPFSQQNIYRRNLERQLESTIARFENVESAEVHLSIPEKQAFIRERVAPTAAVIIKVGFQKKFGESNASSVASLVANSVNGLKMADVSISDTSGQQYTTDATLGQLTKQEEFRYTRERELEDKVQMILAKFLGFGNAAVAVTADYKFPNATEMKRTVDPESKIVIDETILNKTESDSNAVAQGVAGTASNIQGGAGGVGSAKSKGIISKTEDLSNKYDFSHTSRTETIQSPELEKMNVSVVVNKTSVEDESKAVPPELAKKIESLVSQAVGIRDGKDDITVQFFAFVDTLPMEAPVTAVPWNQINEVLKNVSLGLAAIVALVISLKAIGKFQPGAMSNSEAVEAAPRANQLTEMVKENPEVFSKIIEAWSSMDSDTDAGEAKKKAA